MNRFVVRPNGRTTYELVTGHQMKIPLVTFGQHVLWRLPRKRSGAGRLDSEWLDGIFLGLDGTSSEAYIGPATGVEKALISGWSKTPRIASMTSSTSRPLFASTLSASPTSRRLHFRRPNRPVRWFLSRLLLGACGSIQKTFDSMATRRTAQGVCRSVMGHLCELDATIRMPAAPGWKAS